MIRRVLSVKYHTGKQMPHAFNGYLLRSPLPDMQLTDTIWDVLHRAWNWQTPFEKSHTGHAIDRRLLIRVIDICVLNRHYCSNNYCISSQNYTVNCQKLYESVCSLLKIMSFIQYILTELIINTGCWIMLTNVVTSKSNVVILKFSQGLTCIIKRYNKTAHVGILHCYDKVHKTVSVWMKWNDNWCILCLQNTCEQFNFNSK